MKKTFIIFIAALAFASTVFSDQPKIKICAIYPLTGSLAFVGNELRDGITLAKEEMGSSCSNVNVIFEDNAYNLKQTVTAAQKLLNEDKADMLFTLWDGADVVAPITDNLKIPHISIRWNPDVAAKHKFTFTFESTYKSFARDQYEMLVKLGVKSIAIFQVEAQGNMLGAEALKQIAKDDGRIKVLEHVTFNTGTTDFRSLILKANKLHPDMVVTYTWPPETELIIKQLKEIAPNQKHTGYYEVVEDLKVIENVPFLSQLGFAEDFGKKFEKRFGYKFKTRGTHSYELIKYACEVYSKFSDRKPTGEEVVLEFMKIKDRDTVIGKISVNATRNIEHQNYVKIAKNGKLEEYKF